MIRIYHTSDLHDRRGFAPRLRALRDAQPGLLFDCGDSLRGSQTVYHRREPILAEIDAAGYDAQAMGNREFHYLFGCVRARARQMHHPLVCANLIDTKSRPLPFTPTLEIGAGSARVHAIGLLVTQYAQGSPWERVFGWRFLDPVERVREFAAHVPAGEPLIVLSHLGLGRDRKLAAAVPRITLILGGHSHDTLHDPEVIAGVPIVHAGPYGRYVSKTELEPGPAGWQVRTSSLVPLLS
ncbi:MAG TPA: metallophosphoesterase [Candidatus Baltobacteraceae bacterium]|nr:metallophosphoesterase [Candidatus Baltobacteraceae bacterium]